MNTREIALFISSLNIVAATILGLNGISVLDQVFMVFFFGLIAVFYSPQKPKEVTLEIAPKKELQHTICAVCGKDKNTPLRRDEMGGYVCLTCIDKRLDSLNIQLLEMDNIKLEPCFATSISQSSREVAEEIGKACLRWYEDPDSPSGPGTYYDITKAATLIAAARTSSLLSHPKFMEIMEEIFNIGYANANKEIRQHQIQEILNHRI